MRLEFYSLLDFLISYFRFPRLSVIEKNQPSSKISGHTEGPHTYVQKVFARNQMDKHGPLFNTMHNSDSQRSSVGFLTILLEKVGAVNFYCKDKKWKNHLQDFYCYFQYTAIITYIIFHLLSTIVRYDLINLFKFK